jgi:hypothetical protein
MLGKRNKKDSDYSPDDEYEVEEPCLKKRKLPSTVHVNQYDLVENPHWSSVLKS